MAKLKPIHFEFKPKAGDSFKFAATASVSESTGIFSLSIPDELENVAKTAIRSFGTVYGVNLDRPRDNLRVNGSTLEGCKNFIKHVGNDFVSCEVKESLVIVFGINNKVTYVKDRIGKIYPNASDVIDLYKNGEAHWHGALNGSGSYSEFYQIGFVARVVKKTVYSRSSGISSKYSRVINEDADPWVGKLNSFVGLELSYSRMESMEQIPYSEDAAKFFYSVMHGMCQLADRIDSFFGDKIALQSAIENRSPLLTSNLPQ